MHKKSSLVFCLRPPFQTLRNIPELSRIRASRASQEQNRFSQCNEKSPAGESSRGFKTEFFTQPLFRIMLPVK
jgi:hypothetical protein